MRLPRFFKRALGVDDPVVKAALQLPRRSDSPMIDPTRLAAVYRALSILSGSVSQLSLDVERAGTLAGAQPDWVTRPSVYMSRTEFLSQLTLSLATSGNAYIRRINDAKGQFLNFDVLNPAECQPVIDWKTGRETVWYRAKEYAGNELAHLTFMRLPGQVLGLGPMDAARTELANAAHLRDFAARWFTDSGHPAGILSTDQDMTEEQLKGMRDAWNYRDPATGEPMDMSANPSRIRVLSKGLKYEPILISPEDAQWIEARKFSTTEIARLFGVPSSLMLAAVEGSSMTYSNVEQEWIAFARFTLMPYLKAIEDALTKLSPNGQTVRFNLETLLRPDTKSRYEAHALAIQSGLYGPQWARQIEGLPENAAPVEPVKEEE